MPTAHHPSLIETLSSPQVVPTLSLYVGGEWAEAADGRTFDSYEPATGRIWTKIAEAGEEDVGRAVRAACGALEGAWGRTLGPDRARVLWRMAELLDANKEPLARIESRDNGKAIRESRAEIANVIRYFEYFAGMCQNVLGQTMPETGPFFTYTRREPVGVVGAIIPWNLPLVMLAWKVCPALAGGNAIVLKPAQDTPVSALVFASRRSGGHGPAKRRESVRRAPPGWLRESAARRGWRCDHRTLHGADAPGSCGRSRSCSSSHL